ncbi:MAG: L,D-transpeptidase [Ilumatobacter sp.]
MRCPTLIATLMLLGACGSGATDVAMSETVISETTGRSAPTELDRDDPTFSPVGSTVAAAPDATVETEPDPLPLPAATDVVDTEPSPTFLPADAHEVGAHELGTEAAPLDTTATFDLEGCPDTPRAAVTDKANQRYWLCEEGQAVTDEIPMTTASGSYGLPPVGVYPVFARDLDAFGINGEPLERFVAFYTTPRGNRIAFHEVVNQDPATVGDLDQRGASAGCFRVREADSIKVWDFLEIGDPVVVLTN